MTPVHSVNHSLSIFPVFLPRGTLTLDYWVKVFFRVVAHYSCPHGIRKNPILFHLTDHLVIILILLFRLFFQVAELHFRVLVSSKILRPNFGEGTDIKVSGRNPS